VTDLSLALKQNRAKWLGFAASEGANDGTKQGLDHGRFASHAEEDIMRKLQWGQNQTKREIPTGDAADE
jgi:hypothetical protein